MKKLKVILVDDERLAREEIKRHLSNCDDIEITGEAENADEAEILINSNQPDIIFLDIKMPGRSGFDLLESLPVVPEIIFTTAYDNYAVQAFEINAMDYLVKPIRKERFEKAMATIRARFAEKTKLAGIHAAAASLFVKEGDRFYLVKIKDIYLVESTGNYARLYFDKKKVLLRKSLNQLEKILDAAIFFRVSRTAIINSDYIKTIVPLAGGKLSITLESGNTITASARQSAAIKNRTKI